MARLFGLIGFPLSHSFSQRYFTEKFQREGISDCRYESFPIEQIEQFEPLIARHPDLCGLNVTIPYKEKVIPYLTELDESALAVGAVNVIRIAPGKRKGFNTDTAGFRISLTNMLKKSGRTVKGATILGTGGASKAVAWVLRQMQIPYIIVSRRESFGHLSYQALRESHFRDYSLLINTTPLGMSPNLKECPPIQYEFLQPDNILFDLIYNPEETLFLERGRQKGCLIQNGLEMLHAQAEAAWKVWND
jgi:shikimate dehydrogenase